MKLGHVAHQFSYLARTEGMDVEVLTIVGDGLAGRCRELTFAFDCLPGSVGGTDGHIVAEQKLHPGVDELHEVVSAGDRNGEL